MERLLNIPPAPIATVRALERELGVELRARAGARAPRAGRRGGGARVAGGERAARRSRPSPGSTRAVALILAHVRAGTRITVHGDYDVDGVCVDRDPRARAARPRRRRATGTCPSRTEDGYGLARGDGASGSPRAARACCVTADCAITAVDEVARRARARARRRRHRPPPARAPTARCPTRRSCTRRSCGYPCPDLCAAGVAYKLAAALLAAAGARPGAAPTRTSTSSRSPRSPTASRCAARTAGSCARACARSRDARKPGLRALMRVGRGRPGRASTRARSASASRRGINAAGRLHRADAGLELAAHRRPRARRGDRRRARRRQRRAPPRRDADPLRGRGPGRASSASSPPTCSPARTGTRASSASSPRGSPSATTARAC